MISNQDKAKELFANNCNCSQAVLATFSGILNISEKEALSIAAGFGGGMCYQGKTCGAVSSAYMVLGLISGQMFELAEDIKEHTYQLISLFDIEFIKEHKTLECNQLLGVDISTEVGVETAKRTGLFTSKCPVFVCSAVNIIESKILKLSTNK